MIEASENHDAQAMADFANEVKDALQHLYDFPYLQKHPLARYADAAASASQAMRGQWLRREIITTIEALAPESALSFRAPQARPYQILQLRYVEGLTVQEAARELGVSERQAYRDLKRGEDSVAAMLWATWGTESPPDQGQTEQLTSIESEVAGVVVRRTPTAVRVLIELAIRSVDSLARRRNVEIIVVNPASTTISTDPALGAHILTKILSYAVQNTSARRVEMTTEQTGDEVLIQVRFRANAKPDKSLPEDKIALKLAEKLGWAIDHRADAGQGQVTQLRISLHGPTVLIIDDNRRLVELLDRYLTGHACRVVAATSGREGLNLAFQLRPQAIILDVMMPDIDGWQVLQRVRSHPDTADIPVIICSVFDDPELAYSLGASRFIPKPTRRATVLEALRELGVV
jgi:CheY-like chemotaxis protein